ncbi:MAG: acetyl-CoA carboxylase biotin carboxylase subunit [Rhodospirillaceae bacterium]|nr:acetyl-CoA carboxylase biotin carboxylase subunit [Rhodospirillaceae bacterium]
MFKKILIANRGEIACRVIRTARRMGIKTVAVHSDADAEALHVQMADEAVAIGPAPSAQSYLVIERIVEACRQTGAEAVHPGYGFLSEKEAFAKALAEAGIAFIGPPPNAVAAMGDKIESKKLAKKAGVNTVPGYLGEIADAQEAVKIAREIGYPVMIKASAGGGGKGMRIAHNDAETEEGFRSARAEAKNAFADDRVFVEKFVEEPRHIEIQVMADGHGNCLYLGERECSIQRRHQKVIEEAPSPFLDAKTRKAMGEQAVALAQAVGYRSAGTVEFIVDRARNFYFLEMNTRLQVEHPVTEMITGLDLVELMIRVAAGEKLPFTQSQVKLQGWAMEARVYAEDPVRNFVPSIGRLVRYRPPAEDGHVRVDTGVYEGAEISMYYDPMIAKLVTHGGTRDEAIARMEDALDAFYIRGVNHNVAFLSAILAKPRFRAGALTTGFIAEEFPDGFKPGDLAPEIAARLVAVATIAHLALRRHEVAISGRRNGALAAPEPEWHVRLGKVGYDVSVAGAPGDCRVRIAADGLEREVAVASDWRVGEALFRGEIDGRPATVQIERKGVAWRLVHAGAAGTAVVMTRRAAALAAQMPEKAPADTSKFLLSPMPGLLVSLAVKAGQTVRAGEELAVVEAMKMQNVLRAEQDATVKTLHAAPGESLAVDQAIVEFA